MIRKCSMIIRTIRMTGWSRIYKKIHYSNKRIKNEKKKSTIISQVTLLFRFSNIKNAEDGRVKSYEGFDQATILRDCGTSPVPKSIS